MNFRGYPMRQRGRRLPWREIENGPSYVGALISYTTKHGENSYSALALQSGNPAESKSLPALYEPALVLFAPMPSSLEATSDWTRPKELSALCKNGSVEIRDCLVVSCMKLWIKMKRRDMMRATLLAAVIITLLGGCAAQQIRFTKSGASQEEYMKDRYECFQQAQQRVSGAFVNQYGGASNSQVVCNGGMYLSCMGARGYVVDPYGDLSPPPGMTVSCR